MALEAGRKLGPYEIVSLTGAGGMGEVYRGRDTRLARTVALKVLPSRIGDSPTLRARFEREARAIAALSHPNICAIYDVGRDQEIEYLVMEYLEGETLAERIARGPLPMTLVLRYGTQIAEALNAAHRAGITHRDLKPGNIMITAAGAKLLDFGLAQTMRAPDGGPLQSDTPTQAAPLTVEGSILGTLQYMSPEQIDGKPVDPRTDIFSFGVVLYEMITGRRPFDGGSQSAIAAEIRSGEPPSIHALQPAAPAAIERIVVTALEKKPDDRWQTAHDVARQLRWLADSPASGEQGGGRPTKGRDILLLSLLFGALIAALLTWSALRFFRVAPHEGPVVRLDLAPPPGVLPVNSFEMTGFAISPDGKTVCFLGSTGREQGLYLRDLASNEVRRMEGSEGWFAPFWSPDSQWIAFSAGGKLWKTKRSGDTPPAVLCDVGISGARGTWHDHTILFSEIDGGPGIHRIADSGGPEAVITHPGKNDQSWPYFLPDGQHFVYRSETRSNERELVLASLDGTKIGTLMKNVSFARSSASDQLMFVRDGKLLVQRVDAAKATMVGDAVTVADDVTYFFPTGRAYFDAIPLGLVLYRTDTWIDRLVIVDRTGTEKKVVDEAGRFLDLSLSPDATKAATTVLNRGTGLGDIWLYDLSRGIRDRFTSDPLMEFSPLWSRDGRSILYSIADGENPPHIVRRGVDRPAIEDVSARGRFLSPKSFSPDGATLYFEDSTSRTKSSIYRMSMTTHREEPILPSEFSEAEPQVSPDGKWLAYSSDATGSGEVYLLSLVGGTGRRIRISSHGGRAPRWSGDGRELFYLSAERSISAARTASGSWDDTKTEPLFTTPVDIGAFEVLRDGQNFLVIERSRGARDNVFHVILGWH